MKNNITQAVIILIIFAISTSGCLTRTYTKTVDRVDLEIQGQGNQGYLIGIPPADVPKPQKTTRTIQVLEIELGKPIEAPNISSIDESSSRYANIEAIQESQDASVVIAEEATANGETLYDTYVVQPNDTLQKISAKKEVYSTYKKWHKIYEANKDVLSSPSKIYPGQVLKIPRD